MGFVEKAKKTLWDKDLFQTTPSNNDSSTVGVWTSFVVIPLCCLAYLIYLIVQYNTVLTSEIVPRIDPSPIDTTFVCANSYGINCMFSVASAGSALATGTALFSTNSQFSPMIYVRNGASVQVRLSDSVGVPAIATPDFFVRVTDNPAVASPNTFLLPLYGAGCNVDADCQTIAQGYFNTAVNDNGNSYALEAYSSTSLACVTVTNSAVVGKQCLINKPTMRTIPEAGIEIGYFVDSAGTKISSIVKGYTFNTQFTCYTTASNSGPTNPAPIYAISVSSSSSIVPVYADNSNLNSKPSGWELYPSSQATSMNELTALGVGSQFWYANGLCKSVFPGSASGLPMGFLSPLSSMTTASPSWFVNQLASSQVSTTKFTKTTAKKYDAGSIIGSLGGFFSLILSIFGIIIGFWKDYQNRKQNPVSVISVSSAPSPPPASVVALVDEHKEIAVVVSDPEPEASTFKNEK